MNSHTKFGLPLWLTATLLFLAIVVIGLVVAVLLQPQATGPDQQAAALPTVDPDQLTRLAESEGLTAVARARATSAAKFKPVDLSGNGDGVSDKITLKRGLYKFNATHYGKSNFIVRLFDANGPLLDYYVNEIGRYEGTQAVQIKTDGVYFLNVKADGAWTVHITEA